MCWPTISRFQFESQPGTLQEKIKQVQPCMIDTWCRLSADLLGREQMLVMQENMAPLNWHLTHRSCWLQRVHDSLSAAVRG